MANASRQTKTRRAPKKRATETADSDTLEAVAKRAMERATAAILKSNAAAAAFRLRLQQERSDLVPAFDAVVSGFRDARRVALETMGEIYDA